MIYLTAGIIAVEVISLHAAVQPSWINHHSLLATGTNRAVALALDKDSNVILGGHGTSPSTSVIPAVDLKQKLEMPVFIG
jgi:hypothetical protein